MKKELKAKLSQVKICPHGEIPHYEYKGIFAIWSAKHMGFIFKHGGSLWKVNSPEAFIQVLCAG